MLTFRIETTVNPDIQLVSASFHNPVAAQEPIAKTTSIFRVRKLQEKTSRERHRE